MRGIEREGNWLYYSQEDRDRKGEKLALLHAGGEGYKKEDNLLIADWRRGIEREENWLYNRLDGRDRQEGKLGL